MSKHITFDLETLGNTTTAPIVQIGAVKFTEKGKIEDEFLRNINPNSLEEYNFKTNYETIYWWMQQNKEVQESVFGQNVDKVSLRQALYEFTQWLGKASLYTYWSHATFDPPILVYNINEVGINNPIPYRNHRDIRTLTHFSGDINIEQQGIHHNALDGCIYQAKYISKGILKIYEETN